MQQCFTSKQFCWQNDQNFRIHTSSEKLTLIHLLQVRQGLSMNEHSYIGKNMCWYKAFKPHIANSCADPQQKIQSQVIDQFSEDERTEGTHWSNQLVPREALHVTPYWCSKENRTRVSYLPLKIIFVNLYHISKTITKTIYIYLIFNACCSFFWGGESGGMRGKSNEGLPIL